MYYPHRIHLVCTVLLLGLTVCAHAKEDDAIQALSRWIEAHQATEWSGGSELWLDPAGNDADLSNARLRVESERITYTWSYKRAEQTGEIGWTDAGLVWKDTWHQSESVLLRPLPRHGGLLQACTATRPVRDRIGTGASILPSDPTACWCCR